MLSHLLVLHRTGHRDLAHSFQIIQTTRSRSSTGRPHSFLGNSLPRTETASLLVCVDDQIVLGKLVVPVVVGFPTRSTVFRSSPRVSFPRVALQKLRLLLALLFFVQVFWGPGPWLFCFTGSRVPSLAVSLSSRPFGTCFNQPTIHPLGLKASVVHDHCKRRCCGHRISNLLNTLDVKGSQYVTMCILPSEAQAAPRHTDRRHPYFSTHVRGRPHALEFAVYSLSLAFSEFVRTGALPVSEFQTAVSTSSSDLLQNRGNHGCRHTLQEHTQALHKIGTTISRAQPGYSLLCRCTESVAPPQH